MRKFILFSSALLVFFPAFSQKEDQIWLLGYGGGNQSGLNDSFGISILKFDKENNLLIENNQTSDLNIKGSNSSLCNTTGNLLFYCNGERLYNANHSLMINGNNLNITNQNGSRQPQGALSIPFPGLENQYLVLINEDKVFSPQLVAGVKLYQNIVKTNPDNPQENQVILKKQMVIQDTIEWGQITGVKHANGRDWWILVPESHSNRYYTLLLDPSGLTIVDTQAVGAVFRAGLGQAVFSPDGSKYVRGNGIKTTTPTELYIYNFDRRSGKLSHPIHLQYENQGLGTGCAISPNSRFLYAMNASYVFQYDLQATDIPASQILVAEWDGYVHEIHFSTTFAMAQLAPDGKIYIGTAFSTPFLHVIEHPDRKGTACEVQQRAIHLFNYNSYSMPNFPNFRLGPIDGSSCDTLGLDNHPLCNWRWEQEDTLSPLQITFTDLSSYQPSAWHWDFGDGSESQDTSPVHTYATNGTYEVCLVVSNAYSADTLCRVVQLGMSKIDNPDLQNQPLISPNPFQERLYISCPKANGSAFYLYDQTGRLVCEKQLDFRVTDVDTGFLVPGIYFWKVAGNSNRSNTGTLIKMRR